MTTSTIPANAHHQADSPKRYRSRSASQAPTTPPLFWTTALVPEYDQPGSLLWYVARIRVRKPTAATASSHQDSRMIAVCPAEKRPFEAPSRRFRTASFWREIILLLVVSL